MPVKDLYYQKYLKYKNKYLNLCNQLGGGGYSITKTGNTITIYYEGNDDRTYEINNNNTREFISNLPNELNNPNIITIKLEGVVHLYYFIIRHLQKVSSFPYITTLIFDNNDLSFDADIILIVNLIRLFTNVTTLSFKNCNLTDESGKILQKKLLELPKKIPTIHLDDNSDLSKEMIEKFKIITNKKPSIQNNLGENSTSPSPYQDQHGVYYQDQHGVYNQDDYLYYHD